MDKKNLGEAIQATGLAVERVLLPGMNLWRDATEATEMAYVLEGELEVWTGETRLGRIGAGELVGEAGFWPGQLRTAAVSAATRSRLLVLSREHLPGLRTDHQVLYDRLLDTALRSLAERVSAVDKDIAVRAQGSRLQPDAGKPRWWQSLVDQIRGADPGDPPPAEAVLRRLPALKGCPSPVMMRIKRALTAKSYRKGEAVFLEQDEGTDLFLLGAGQIDVLRNARGDRAIELATLNAGALFGTGCWLLGGRRNASCVVASEHAWVYQLTPEATRSLEPEAARTWGEAVAEALRHQLATADEHIAALTRSGKEPDPDDYDRIAGVLAAFQPGD
jgi:CRP-like cAMP-binding protein